MVSFTRPQRIGVGLLLGLLLIAFGASTPAHRAYESAVVLLLLAPFTFGLLVGKDSPIGRPLLSLGLVALLSFGVFGSASIHLGLAFVVLIAGSFGIGYILPTRWTPAFVAITPLVVALILSTVVDERGVAANGAAGFASISCSFVALVFSYIGLDQRRHRNQPRRAPDSPSPHPDRW